MNNAIQRSVLALAVTVTGGLTHSPAQEIPAQEIPAQEIPTQEIPTQEIDFSRDVRPILAANCFACHGPDERAREADLRLDIAAGATVDRSGHWAIKPGDADASELVSRIESDDQDEIMPPGDSGHRLTDRQKQLLRRWVDAGGKYELHWSFAVPTRGPPTADRCAHPIDSFVREKLSQQGLAANDPADRYQLIRRVSLDLTGLPATPQQADAFAADLSADAFEKVVDRLLASGSFGEHWARMWLDLALC